MPDLLLPAGRTYAGWVPPEGAHLADVPLSIKQRAIGSARDHAQIDELLYRIGPATMPPAGFFALYDRVAKVTKLIVTDGVTEMAELAQIMHASLERPEFDFNAARERANMVRRENVAAAAAEAIQDRIRRHKANPITDPPRQPLRWPPRSS